MKRQEQIRRVEASSQQNQACTAEKREESES
jgi:hypothetical protein